VVDDCDEVTELFSRLLELVVVEDDESTEAESVVGPARDADDLPDSGVGISVEDIGVSVVAEAVPETSPVNDHVYDGGSSDPLDGRMVGTTVAEVLANDCDESHDDKVDAEPAEPDSPEGLGEDPVAVEPGYSDSLGVVDQEDEFDGDP